MNLQDETRNQHFIARVDQKLNCINPNANEKNRKIYSFSLIEREEFLVKLDSMKGVKIGQSLSLLDIFSFDILEKETTIYNFEKLFEKYETSIEKNTIDLTSKLDIANEDVTSEVKHIFLAKFLNFVRNPHSIKKVLDTFPEITKFHPTDDIQYKNFKRVLNGRKPQQEFLCNKLGISKSEYTEWLAVIFLLLSPIDKNRLNIFEQIVTGLFEDKNTFIMVMVYSYDNETCLLSDRGYSIPLPDETHLTFDFNLNKHAFIRYNFVSLDRLVQDKYSKKQVEYFKSSQKRILVRNIKNDLDSLEQYNKNVVYQCFQNIFNSKQECYGL